MLVVTGASGFLGRALVAKAAACGLPVTAVSRRAIEPVSGARMIQVADYAELPFIPGATLIHLAEEADIAASEKGGSDHVARTRGALASLAAKGWRHVVYASSGAVYGDQATYPRREDEPAIAAGFYRAAKLACEGIATNAGGVALRLGNLYGAGMSQGIVVSDIMAQLGKPGPVWVRDLSPARDFIHVEDAVAGFLRAAERGLTGIYNLGTGIGTSVENVARTALLLAGEPQREVIDTDPAGRRSYLCLDIARIAKDAGWRPAITLEAGLARLIGGTR